MKNQQAYLLTMAAIKAAFPSKEYATFTEVARFMGISRAETLRETSEFPRMTVGKRDVVPLRALAVYMTNRGNVG